MEITTRSGKILPCPSVGKILIEDVTEADDEPKEECPVDSETLDGSDDAPEKKKEKEMEVVVKTLPRPPPPLP